MLSETDNAGIILYANDIFCELANYSREELIGEPHNILRHKDMPRVAFQGLWDDVKNKGFWVGIVKNQRKDGGYYWVKATVLRKVDSNGKVTYLSTRLQPTREEVNNASALYKELRKQE
ncbi:PAS domain-containing protein [Sulfurimonas sp.]|nr:PAS domain-containing protein [Sulfurimonas sp.]